MSNLIHCCGFEFNSAEDPLFHQVLDMVRTLPLGKYTTPGRNRVGGELLDLTANTSTDENLDKAVDEGDVFGILGYGD